MADIDPQQPNPVLGARFVAAVAYALGLHAHQTRKGTRIPYGSHLLSVAGLVLEAGGDEDLAIAALLHDAPEDQGGEPVLREIRQRFGERVARIVAGCTDTYVQGEKPEWCDRKRKYLAHVREHADLDTCIVSAADKLHNARSILTDHHAEGNQVFDRFRGRAGQEGHPRDRQDRTVWYHRELVEAYRIASRRTHRDEPVDRRAALRRLVNELDRVVTQIEERAGRVDYNPCPE